MKVLSVAVAAVIGAVLVLRPTATWAQTPVSGTAQSPVTGTDAQVPTGPARGDDNDNASDRKSAAPAPMRPEPQVRAPADPLAIPPDVAERIGTDADEPPTGKARFRMLPPLWLEHRRATPAGDDRQSLYGLFYYQRRSAKFDADVLFPLAWHLRDDQSHVTVFGPFAHREAPGQHDNWVAPLFFQGKQVDGGYFHAPLLLTTSRHSPKGAFALVGPYFRNRTDTDVDMGVAPLFFHGDNGNEDGARRTYTLIPPLLYYHRERELDESRLTVVGPVVSEVNQKRRIFDIAPLFFRIDGRPEANGKAESHTTLFPFFHYGRSEKQNLFIVPGYLRRTTPTADTMLTPLVSHATTRNGSTSLTAVGPVLPLFFRYRDKDTGAKALALAPLFYTWSSPTGSDFLVPLFGRFETYGVSRSWWFFPTLTVSRDLHGWSTNLHPLVYTGRSDDSSHTVLAPLFWDFASNKGRSTVAFPLYWRFADTPSDSVTQVAGNTLYLQKKVAGGSDWSFHFLPVFSYGQSPKGHFWNVLFGLAGYSRDGEVAKIRALWIPIQVAGPKGEPAPMGNASSWQPGMGGDRF